MSGSRRRICVVVASRANYARIKSVLEAVRDHPELELQLVAGASLVLERFGNAADVLEAEGFAVNLCGIAVEDADLFHLLEPLAGCGGREANAARQLGKAEAGICLKFVEELSSMDIE